MINALHLLWILPVTFMLGFFLAAVLAVGKMGE
jgi:hypothetical protein